MATNSSRKRIPWVKAVIGGAIFGALVSLGVPHAFPPSITFVLQMAGFFAALTFVGAIVAWLLFDRRREDGGEPDT